MSDLRLLYRYTINYFETKSQDEKSHWVEKAINLLYDIEDDDLIEECIFDFEDEKFMQNIQQYVFYKDNILQK